MLEAPTSGTHRRKSSVRRDSDPSGPNDTQQVITDQEQDIKYPYYCSKGTQSLKDNVRVALMSYILDTALLFTLERCVQERNGQAESLIKENSPSTVYRSHWTTRSTAANQALVTAPNEPPSLYQAVHHSFTLWAC